MKKVFCVDLFCGAGGLTHGFVLESAHRRTKHRLGKIMAIATNATLTFCIASADTEGLT